MSGKPFRELTKDEATAILRQIVNSSNSEDEIKRRLTGAGFNGEAAIITSLRMGGKMFVAEVMAFGPDGKPISACST